MDFLLDLKKKQLININETTNIRYSNIKLSARKRKCDITSSQDILGEVSININCKKAPITMAAMVLINFFFISNYFVGFSSVLDPLGFLTPLGNK